ncbi:MAG TPA: class I SAM-dependent methyltransferase [Bacteroidales bacterium]|nr:class I SAM-dependent methyltransferase [Bacteroidales bacterium]HPS16633.1 class I SAM-dependent methyltransferase [Bacteroidales bacterium]
MEKINNCPVCENTEFLDYMICTDFFLTKEKFNLVKCNKCDFIFINPRPENYKLGQYYNSPDYISHSGTEKGIINKIYKIVRQHTHNKKYKLINSFSKKKNVLDIGCASGELLSLFKKNNWKTLGLEPNEEARNFAKNQYNIDVIDEVQISTLHNDSFDNITLWHVLEHVPDLNTRIKELKRILTPEGFLFVAVPHCDSFDAGYYKEYWAAYDVPRHLYHFTPITLEKIFNKHGFSIVKKLPMKFDSYYVSMLSEKYKTGKQSIIKGFITGYLSNKKAKSKKYSYSSQIYVLKKDNAF